MTDSNQPEGFEQHTPSGKKSKGPSMKERLIAQRKADAAAAPDETKPEAQAKKPAAKKAAKKAGVKKPAGKRAAAAKAPSGDGEAPTTSKRSAGSRRSGGSSRRRGAAAGDGEGEEGGGRRGRRPSPEKNMTPIFAGVGVVIIAAVAFFFMQGEDKNPAAQEQTTEETAAADAAAATAKEAADEKAAADAAKEQAASDKAAADAAAEKEKADAKAAEPKEPEGPATEAPRNKKGLQAIFLGDAGLKYPDDLYDPSDAAEPQIATFEPFGQPSDCSAEDWAEIEKRAKKMVDLDSPAQGTRASLQLEQDYGKNALPALINELLKLDYTTQEGQETGDFIQRTASKISMGRNANWRYGFDTEPNKTIIQNRRTVNVWYGVWAKVIEDPTYWDRFAGQTEAAKRAKAGAGSSNSSEDASDDDADDLDDLLDDL